MDITIQQAADRLLEHDFITILCHRSPDGDTLGSGYALYHGLRGLGKYCRLRCADPAPPNMVQFLGSTGEEAETEAYVVAVDIADAALLGSLEAAYSGRVDLAIDHHPSNSRYGKETCLDQGASATAQVIAHLLDCMGVTLTPVIASCLYLGLATDTGCFRYSNTTPDALRIVARLLESGINAAKMNRVLFETKTKSRLAVECQVLQTMEYFHEGRCAVITVPLSTVAQFGAAEHELDGISSLPRQIQGVWVGITIREQESGCCRVSVRTNSEMNASALCAAFGGGGHVRAAGCTICAGIDQAKAMLVAEVGRQMEKEAAL